jgi:hypothetical protein
MTKNREYDNFDRTMQELLKVPHSELRAKLDAEKTEKQTKKRKSRASASGHASRAKD